MMVRLRASVAFAAFLALVVAFGGLERWASTAESAAKAGASIDLLKQIDLKKHVLRGEWRIEQGALVSPAATAKIALPGAAPAAYRLSLAIEPTADTGAVHVVLVCGHRRVTLVLNSGADPSGLHLVKKVSVQEQPAAYRGPPIFKKGQPTHVDISVDRGSIRVTCDGKAIVDWQGDPQDLFISSQTATELPPRQLGITTYRSGYRFTKIALTPLVPAPAAESSAAKSGSVDLLKQVDLKTHVHAGEWRIDGGSLVSPADAEMARVALPGVVPDAYRLSITAQKVAAEDGIDIVIVVAGRQTAVLLDGGATDKRPMVVGLHMVGKGAVLKPVTAIGGPVFKESKPVNIDIFVDGRTIRVDCDGKRVLTWNSNPQDLNLHLRRYGGFPSKSLGLATYRGSYRFTKVELTPVASKGAAPEIAKPGQSVVLIEHPMGKGSGFVVGEDLVATNAHVIRRTFPEDVKVLFPKGNRSPEVVRRVVWEDEGRDLALLELSTKSSPLRVAAKHEFRQGETVTLIGNPSVGSGIVARNTTSEAQLAAQVRIGKHDFYQIAGDVNPGSSGGPVLDRSGSVVAVVAMKATDRGAAALQDALAKFDDTFSAYFGGRPTEGAAFAIPAPALAEAMSQVGQRSAAYPEQMNAAHAARTLCYRLMTLASLALAETQANVPASMRQQAAAGSGTSPAGGTRRPAPDKRRRLPLLATEEAQRLARELESPAVQAMKENCSKDLSAQFQKAQRTEYLEEITRRDLEQLYRLVSQMRRYAEKPQSDYFVHSAKVLGFVGDLKTIVKRLEEQLGMQQP